MQEAGNEISTAEDHNYDETDAEPRELLYHWRRRG